MSDGRYILLLSPHGLIRGHDLELGRDADTGGQTKYVVELARALAADDRVDRVDLVTRRIEDRNVDDDYARREEELAPGARIVRLDFGPRRYLRKESLWPHLDHLTDAVLVHLRTLRRLPYVIHSHYADAGYVGAGLDSLLPVPLVHTGHSLGRIKLQRLLDQGTERETVEKRFKITRRIEAEETALDHAALVIASTRQEMEEQYALYANHHPERIEVIPPGTDLERFRPPRDDEPRPPIGAEIDRFLRDPGKPMILALARPDRRKNLVGLVNAYGRRESLREVANLVIFAGTRDDVAEMRGEARRELRRLFVAIDRHDLHGHVAYPKHHSAEDVPDIYRLATRRRGVFVNPALTEPFGLTLIEAAASGLPVVATDDGGPRDIIAACDHGTLVDALDGEALGSALEEALRDRERWERWSRNGPQGARQHYRWASHVDRYLERLRDVAAVPRERAFVPDRPAPLTLRDRLLVSDIDGTLLGDREALAELLGRLDEHRWGLGVATGRRVDSAARVLREWGVPAPDLVISSVGAEIHYGPRLVQDVQWARHLDYRWRPDEIREVILAAHDDVLELQADSEQRRHKISFDVREGAEPPSVREIRHLLRERDLNANVVFSHGRHLDVLPIRCSKGRALRWVAQRWGIELASIVVAGDSGNDRDMLTGATPAVVVGNHSEEIADLSEQPSVCFTRADHAAGILEGLEALELLPAAAPGLDR